MTNTAHTPTPWRIYHLGNREGTAISGNVPTSENLATHKRIDSRILYGGDIAFCYGDQHETDAAHIVRCVNAHDALVADNERLRAALRDCVAELEAYEQDRAQRDMCARARAALAKEGA